MTLRRLDMMMEGRLDAVFDAFWLHQDDAWERSSRIVAMIHNSVMTSRSACKSWDDFNHHKQWLEEADTEKRDVETEEAFAWARANSNGQSTRH